MTIRFTARTRRARSLRTRLAFWSSVTLLGGCSPNVVPRAPAEVTASRKVPRQTAPTSDSTQAWRRVVPKAGNDAIWSYPAPVVAKLSNQLTVYVVRRPIGPVALSVVVRRGGGDVPPEKSGLASLTAQLMVEATKTKNHYALSEAAEALGSTLAADANRDSLRMTLDTLPEDVERGIALLTEAFGAPAFEKQDFLRLQKQHLDDLVAERQSPSRLASLVGLRAVLGEHQGAPVGGRLASVRQLTISDVREWHRRYVIPREAALFVVGPVDPERIIAVAESSIGQFRSHQPPSQSVATPIPAPQGTIFLVDRPGSVQTAMFATHTYPARNEPGYAARQVLDNVIGGQFTSRINQNLREQHAYTYGARSGAIATRNFGLFTVSTSVETAVTAAAMREVVRELHDLRGKSAARPITIDELHRAKTGIVQSLGAHLEDGNRIAIDQEQLFVHGLSPAYFDEYLKEVRNLEAAQVSAETERLTPDELTFVLVGDAASVRPQLEAAGLPFKTPPAEWLD